MLINFLINMLILKNYIKDGYNSMLIIVHKLIKRVYYKFVKITINLVKKAKIIIDYILMHYKFLDFLISGKNALFILNYCHFYATSWI